MRMQIISASLFLLITVAMSVFTILNIMGIVIIPWYIVAPIDIILFVLWALVIWIYKNMIPPIEEDEE